jgi:hypothetical protein
VPVGAQQIRLSSGAASCKDCTGWTVDGQSSRNRRNVSEEHLESRNTHLIPRHAWSIYRNNCLVPGKLLSFPECYQRLGTVARFLWLTTRFLSQWGAFESWAWCAAAEFLKLLRATTASWFPTGKLFIVLALPVTRRFNHRVFRVILDTGKPAVFKIAEGRVHYTSGCFGRHRAEELHRRYSINQKETPRFLMSPT